LCRFLPWVGPLTVVIYPLVYRVGFWTLTGWTPGMGLLGLRLVRCDGRRVRLRTAVIRLLAATLTALTLGVGYLLVLVSPRRQALHDRIAGTVMLQARATPPASKRLDSEFRTSTATANRHFLTLHFRPSR
jgi:uncharacterized RDD family membrane protein YckC